MRIDLRTTRMPHSHIIRKHRDYPLEASCPRKVATRYCSLQIGIECGHAVEGTRGTMSAVSPLRSDDNVMTFSTTCVRSFLSAKLLGAQYCDSSAKWIEEFTPIFRITNALNCHSISRTPSQSQRGTLRIAVYMCKNHAVARSQLECSYVQSIHAYKDWRCGAQRKTSQPYAQILDFKPQLSRATFHLGILFEISTVISEVWYIQLRYT